MKPGLTASIVAAIAALIAGAYLASLRYEKRIATLEEQIDRKQARVEALERAQAKAPPTPSRPPVGAEAAPARTGTVEPAPPALPDRESVKPASSEPCTEFAAVTPETILDDGEPTAPYERRHIREAYVGTCVRWTLQLFSVLEMDDDEARAILKPEEGERVSVEVTTTFARSPELTLARRLDRLQVEGRIARVAASTISLREATIMRPPPTAAPRPKISSPASRTKRR